MVDEAPPKEIPHVFIGTPAYGGMVHTDYVQTLLGLSGMTHELHIAAVMLGNESLVTRGRNSLISLFHQKNMQLRADPDGRPFTHLLWLDADVGVAPKDVLKLVTQGYNVTSATVALKGYQDDGSPVLNGEPMPGAPATDEWVQMYRIGNACLCFSAEAVTRLVEFAIFNKGAYKGSELARGPHADQHFEVFKNGVHNGEYETEDWYVCRILREELGMNIWCNQTIATTHSGTWSFRNMT